MRSFVSSQIRPLCKPGPRFAHPNRIPAVKKIFSLVASLMLLCALGCGENYTVEELTEDQPTMPGSELEAPTDETATASSEDVREAANDGLLSPKQATHGRVSQYALGPALLSGADGEDRKPGDGGRAAVV